MSYPKYSPIEQTDLLQENQDTTMVQLNPPQTYSLYRLNQHSSDQKYYHPWYIPYLNGMELRHKAVYKNPTNILLLRNLDNLLIPTDPNTILEGDLIVKNTIWHSLSASQTGQIF